jgi:predicted GNAT family acetyltransferase
LQWINVIENYRRNGIATALLKTLAGWLVRQNAFRVCVDVDSGNAAARGLYSRYGAQPLNPHWMIWQDIREVYNSEKD